MVGAYILHMHIVGVGCLLGGHCICFAVTLACEYSLFTQELTIHQSHLITFSGELEVQIVGLGR